MNGKRLYKQVDEDSDMRGGVERKGLNGRASLENSVLAEVLDEAIQQFLHIRQPYSDANSAKPGKLDS